MYKSKVGGVKKKFGFGGFSLSSSFHKAGQKHSANWDKRTKTEDE